jgi:hypothetical protein
MKLADIVGPPPSQLDAATVMERLRGAGACFKAWATKKKASGQKRQSNRRKQVTDAVKKLTPEERVKLMEALEEECQQDSCEQPTKK